MSDPAARTDGLADLMGRRTAAKGRVTPKREIPRSQNPVALPPYEAPAVGEQSAEPAPEPAVPVPTPPTSVPPTPRKIGLYVDEAHDDFFQAVRAAGLAQRPRVSLSGSAVVRLAMDRLMADMTADQVRDAIVARQPSEPAAPGRKRW